MGYERVRSPSPTPRLERPVLLVLAMWSFGSDALSDAPDVVLPLASSAVPMGAVAVTAPPLADLGPETTNTAPSASPGPPPPSDSSERQPTPPVATPPDELASRNEPPKTPEEATVKRRYHWLDRTHDVLYEKMWHSAEHVDRWFGSVEDDTVYQQVYGSIAPAILWDRYNGTRTQLRFNMSFPLPVLNDRFHAFVGRFDPNEFISEANENSGAFQRQYGPPTEDQTLFGLAYHEPPKQGGRWDAGVGVRIAFPMTPYLKGSYIFERGSSEVGLASLRQTAFWYESDGFGTTSRLDLEKIYQMHWLLRYTLSGSVATKIDGIRAYTTVLALRGLPNRRAIAVEAGMDGQTGLAVPLHSYGVKVAYRQGILRRWLIMEVRTSIEWPKDYVWQSRASSLGVGVGFEMLFGTTEFLARPVTF